MPSSDAARQSPPPSLFLALEKSSGARTKAEQAREAERLRADFPELVAPSRLPQ